MAIEALAVKELRERTGAGMMDCKKALQAANGDIEKAIEDMRKSGIAKAAKKAGRIAAEGMIMIKQNKETGQMVIAEINSETDFVARDDNFKSFCNEVASCILARQPTDIDSLMECNIEKQTVEETRQQLVVKIGENISVRRFSFLDSDKRILGSYLHGVRIGVIVELAGGDESVAKDIAMHIAASNPVCIAAEDAPEDILSKEKEIFIAQAKASDKPKPPEIIEKMISGRMNKFLKQISLLSQPFIKDPDQTVSTLLESAGATVKGYVRYEVGEGIEKQNDNFAEEVMAQAKG